MSVIINHLKSLKPGNIIHLTQNNGVTFEGIVKENDGINSLSVEVSINVSLQYGNIATIERISQLRDASIPASQIAKIIADQANNVHLAQTHKQLTQKVSTYNEMKEKYPKFSSGMQNIETTFKLLDRKTRMIVQGQLSKIRDANSVYNFKKIKSATKMLWKIIMEKELYYDPMISIFMAYVNYLAKHYAEAASNFFLGEDYYSAFASVITNAIKLNNIELYKYGAVYSSIYIIECPKGENLNEALQALEIASVMINDLSAICFVLGHSKDDFVRSSLHEALIRIAEYKKFELPNTDNLNSMLEALKHIFPDETILKWISEIYHEESEKTEDLSVTSEYIPDAETFTDLTKEYVGTIVSFNNLDGNGIIENKIGMKYRFEAKNIWQSDFRSKISSMSQKDFEPIDVRFYLTKAANSLIAVKIKKLDSSSLTKHEISDAKQFFIMRKYEDAINVYQNVLDDENNLEEAFIGIMNCYLALDNAEDKIDYTPKMKSLVDKYASRMKRNIKILSILFQYYMKVKQYNDAIKMLDDIIALIGKNNYKRFLFCISEKARCFRALNMYSEAIEQYEYWIKTVNENKYSDLYFQRDVNIYPEIAKLYYNIKEYDYAKKYRLLSQPNEKNSKLHDVGGKRAKRIMSFDESDNIFEYDSLMLCLDIVSDLKCSSKEKQYIAEFASITAKGDYEIAKYLAEKGFDLIENPYETVQDVFKAHKISYTNLSETVDSALWEAQTKIVFPIIEAYRKYFSEKYNKQLINYVPFCDNRTGQVITNVNELEIGHLFFFSEKYYFASKADHYRLSIMKDARNYASHWNIIDLRRFRKIIE